MRVILSKGMYVYDVKNGFMMNMVAGRTYVVS